jgi:hypothetical protein
VHSYLAHDIAATAAGVPEPAVFFGKKLERVGTTIRSRIPLGSRVHGLVPSLVLALNRLTDALKWRPVFRAWLTKTAVPSAVYWQADLCREVNHGRR